ncbi:hypothetical protein VZT92_017685 [Zoarces viviparus]
MLCCLFSEGGGELGSVRSSVSVRQMGASRGHAVTGRAGLDPWVLRLQGDKVTFSVLYSGTERRPFTLWLPLQQTH